MCEFQEYGGECRGSGSSLLIFIELAPSKNDNCEEVKGLLSVFQKHGVECTGLLLILNVAEIRPIEADKLLRRIRKRQRERRREGGTPRRVTTGPAGHRVQCKTVTTRREVHNDKLALPTMGNVFALLPIA